MKMSSFFGRNIAGGSGGGGGGDEMNPKLVKKIVSRGRVLRNNYLEGLFHTVPSSFVPRHCCYTSYTSYTSGRIRLRVSNKS